MVESPLPVIDIDIFRRGGDEIDERVRALDEACREVGFFAITGHGIDRPLVDYLLEQCRRFFDQPIEAKEAIAIGRSCNHTGYVGFAAERLQADIEPDAKEALDLALEPAALLASGAWPSEPISQMPSLEHFAETVVAYQRAAMEAATIVLRGLAIALDLRAGFFERRMRQPSCNLRMVHYPPLDAAARRDDVLGCGTHTDYGLVTLLLTDGVDGLEVRRRDGTWVRPQVPDGALVVNLGDMLARWTNDRYVSTPHRVTNPTGRHRYSVPFFVNPDADAVVEVMPSCVSGDEPARYEPVRAADYLASRFDETHAYRVA
jgi:isopenicillin N synthase-like dioxygenase